PVLALDELVGEIHATHTDFCVITGGEPALYNLEGLIQRLKNKGIETAIETSGCYPLHGNIDWYCFSPKKFKAPCAEAYERADELKIVISHPSDFAWAETHAEKVKASCK